MVGKLPAIIVDGRQCSSGWWAEVGQQKSDLHHSVMKLFPAQPESADIASGRYSSACPETLWKPQSFMLSTRALPQCDAGTSRSHWKLHHHMATTALLPGRPKKYVK